MKKKLIIVLTIVISILSISVLYVNDYYRSEEGIQSYLENTKEVSVNTISEGMFFDGKGTEEAFIFYPGGKVEYTAYAPLMQKLAREGIDCFLLKMPCNLAILDMNKASQIQKEYAYDIWHMGGHSLGGAAASAYAAEPVEEIKSLLLLGAYPMEDLSKTDMSVMSVYGSEDQVLNQEKFEEGRALMPKDVTYKEIIGGNHAWFGLYGEQEGDGKANISKEEQWKVTVESCMDMLK